MWSKRRWHANLLRAVLISAVLLGAARFAFGQQPPLTDRLYAVLTRASQTGWTTELRREAGDIALALGDFEAALAHWEAALLLSPDETLLMRRTAELYVQRMRWPQALDAVRRLLAAVPDDPWGMLHLGLLLAPSAPQDAAAALRRAAQGGMPPPDGLVSVLEAPRDNPRSVALEVGAVLAEAKLYAYAERAFTLAVTLDTARGEALASIALVRGLQSKDGQAWLNEAFAVAPDSPQVFAAAGYYYRAIGQSFLSLTAFANALALAPLDAELYAELGISYDLIGDPETALFWYEQAVYLKPDEPRYAELQRRAMTTLDGGVAP